MSDKTRCLSDLTSYIEDFRRVAGLREAKPALSLEALADRVEKALEKYGSDWASTEYSVSGEQTRRQTRDDPAEYDQWEDELQLAAYKPVVEKDASGDLTLLLAFDQAPRAGLEGRILPGRADSVKMARKQTTYKDPDDPGAESRAESLSKVIDELAEKNWLSTVVLALPELKVSFTDLEYDHDTIKVWYDLTPKR